MDFIKHAYAAGVAAALAEFGLTKEAMRISVDQFIPSDLTKMIPRGQGHLAQQLWLRTGKKLRPNDLKEALRILREGLEAPGGANQHLRLVSNPHDNAANFIYPLLSPNGDQVLGRIPFNPIYSRLPQGDGHYAATFLGQGMDSVGRALSESNMTREQLDEMHSILRGKLSPILMSGKAPIVEVVPDIATGRIYGYRASDSLPKGSSSTEPPVPRRRII